MFASFIELLLRAKAHHISQTTSLGWLGRYILLSDGGLEFGVVGVLTSITRLLEQAGVANIV